MNLVRRGFYADSVALMRIARELNKEGAVASLMIGTPSNKALLKDSGLLTKAGAAARPDDLIIAVKGRNAAAALALAQKLLSAGSSAPASEKYSTHASLGSAVEALPVANLALISVPGEFAAAEARRALERGLHVMVFSDNVPVADEVALKDLAVQKGLLLMGPDCGTALIAGAPIAFANAVPRGDTGIVSASGTGLQEVSCLLARAGRGVSHGIGVGGRDLSREVGGRMTLAAMDALDADPATRRIIVISKPPAPAVARKIVARAGRSKKPVVLCLLGAGQMKLPRNVTLARTLEDAAGAGGEGAVARDLSGKLPHRKPAARIAGLFCGGTLCAEARIVLGDQGLKIGPDALIDLGDDQYTRGRPHPMIEPALRNEYLAKALRDRDVGVILLDVVIGYGAHPDPAGLLAGLLKKTRKTVIASVTGTEGDPQVYSRQVATLRDAGVLVADSNAAAARIAATALLGKPSPARRRRRSGPHSRSR